VLYLLFAIMKTRLIAVLLLLAAAASAQLSESGKWAAGAQHYYRVMENIVYSTANGHENKLDLYIQRNPLKPLPVLVYIHGGGWIQGTKEMSLFGLLPYLEWGWNVVNVEYRMGGTSLAPAAVEDFRCALHWIFDHAAEYRFDTSRVVITGTSAGGHLSLTTGMLSGKEGFDRTCPSGDKPIKAAAIVNWFGITDVNDVLEGANQKRYAVRWFGNQPDRERIATSVSPMNMIRPDLPPILSIHGDADPTVPYQHAVRLHKALDDAKVPNKLLTVAGGQHGGFGAAELERLHAEIRAFLTRHVLEGK